MQRYELNASFYDHHCINLTVNLPQAFPHLLYVQQVLTLPLGNKTITMLFHFKYLPILRCSVLYLQNKFIIKRFTQTSVHSPKVLGCAALCYHQISVSYTPPFKCLHIYGGAASSINHCCMMVTNHENCYCIPHIKFHRWCRYALIFYYCLHHLAFNWFYQKLGLVIMLSRFGYIYDLYLKL